MTHYYNVYNANEKSVTFDKTQMFKGLLTEVPSKHAEDILNLVNASARAPIFCKIGKKAVGDKGKFSSKRRTGRLV